MMDERIQDKTNESIERKESRKALSNSHKNKYGSNNNNTEVKMYLSLLLLASA